MPNLRKASHVGRALGLDGNLAESAQAMQRLVVSGEANKCRCTSSITSNRGFPKLGVPFWGSK